MDDETLQKQEVYLPSLPPEYEAQRLAQVMQRQQVFVSKHFYMCSAVSEQLVTAVVYYVVFILSCVVFSFRSYGWSTWTRSVYSTM